MKNTTMSELPKGRIVSIDALRGFDMFWIIGADWLFIHLFRLMDNPLGRALETQLHHCEWNGFRFYDLIFPMFLFIMGASMPFAITKRIERGDSRGDLYRHIIRRSVTLLAFGFLFNGFLNFDLANMRWAGVLQRIALCYFFAALIVMNTKARGQAIWAGAILVGYWVVMMLIPVPGHGAGVLTPEGNFASYVDRLLLPGRFCCFEFGDNEGLLSTIPSVATTLMGVLSGHWLRMPGEGMKKVKGLAIAGVVSIAAGFLWGFVFPVNKLIWTSSYVLVAGGWSILLLMAFYWIIDVRGLSKWAFPFIVIGMNAITIYMAQRVIDFGGIARFFIEGLAAKLGSLEMVLILAATLAAKWLFLYFLYKRRIFLKV